MFGAWGNPDHDDSSGSSTARSTPGINFVDTADVYSRGESEEIVGKALEGPPRRRRAGHQVPRDAWATTRTSSATRAAGSSARSRTACAGCGTDWIDLYQMHRPEPDTDIDETLGALTDLVHAGKVRYIGSSTFPPSADRRGAVGRRERRGRERFVCEQPPYSILVRGVEADVLPTCAALRHGRDPVEPAGRRLAVRPLPAEARPRPHAAPAACSRAATTSSRPRTSASSRPWTRSRAGRGGRAPLIHLALAFVLAHPAVTSAIIGPRTMEHLESQLAAAEVDARPTTSSTASTRSCRRAPTSTRPTPAGRTQISVRRPAAVAPERKQPARPAAHRWSHLFVRQRGQPHPVDDHSLEGQPGVEAPTAGSCGSARGGGPCARWRGRSRSAWRCRERRRRGACADGAWPRADVNSATPEAYTSSRCAGR